MAVQVQAMLTLQDKGAATLDYGNNIRQVAKDQGVDNAFDFGLRSHKPAHHLLLDWLAVELMENNWSMKHLHRLITTSETYAMSSRSPDHELHSKRDPDDVRRRA